MSGKKTEAQAQPVAPTRNAASADEAGSKKGPPKQRTPSILILTGHSGSGKSTAIHALEDSGYYCVDNLPVALVEALIAEVAKAKKTPRLALVMDLRDQAFSAGGPALIAKLRRGPHATRLVFLEAQEDVVVRRYSQTRRLHPLDDGLGLRAAIVREREVMRPLRELADEAIDTSQMSPHALRHRVTAQLGVQDEGTGMRVSLVSFGFKHGVPTEADMMLDVRFLPNPYFDPALSPMSGRQKPVADFVLGKPETQELFQRTLDFLRFLLPHYAREGKRYFTLAIGCTGGRHRSVALAEAIGRALSETGSQAEVRHRDVELHQPAAKAGPQGSEP